MDAFISYGKVSQLKEYFKDAEGPLRNLLQVMQDVDYAISLCDTVKMEAGIQKLREGLNRDFTALDSTEAEQFRVLRDGLVSDYGTMLEGDTIDPVELIHWIRRKDFMQQTMTLIESKVPEILVDKKILYYRPEEETSLIASQAVEGEDSAKNESIKRYFVRKFIYDKEGRNITWENKLRRRVTNNPDTISYLTVLPEEDWNDIIQLIWDYKQMKRYRNQINHALENVPSHKTIEDSVDRFMDSLESLIERARQI